MSDDGSESDSELDELTEKAETRTALKETRRIKAEKMAEPGDNPPCHSSTLRPTQDSDVTQVSSEDPDSTQLKIDESAHGKNFDKIKNGLE